MWNDVDREVCNSLKELFKSYEADGTLWMVTDARQLIEDKGIERIKKMVSDVITSSLFVEIRKALNYTDHPENYLFSFQGTSDMEMKIGINLPVQDKCVKNILKYVGPILQFNWNGHHLDFPFCDPPIKCRIIIGQDRNKKITSIEYILIIPQFYPESHPHEKSTPAIYDKVYSDLAGALGVNKDKLYAKINHAWYHHIVERLGADTVLSLQCSVLDLK